MQTDESWGRYPRLHAAQRVHLHDRRQPLPKDYPGTLLAHGNGRSYGDSCLNADGTALMTRGLDRYIDFDVATGILRCESGVLFADVLDVTLPQGWYLPVVPGTRLITVGGAIANDIHGKNHHQAGSFGRHLRRFELLRSDGSRLECAPDSNSGLYAATIGGLGLTGLITWAEIQLAPVPGPWLAVETLRFESIDEYLKLIQAREHSHAFRVAWIDCLAPAHQRGRGLLTCANFVDDTAPRPRSLPMPRTIPFVPPVPLVGGLGMRRFNQWYWSRRRARHARQYHLRYFYPLDGIGHWNRLYGPAGLLQHQCVLPPDAVRAALDEMLAAIGQSGGGSPLAVLKQFGPLSSPGLLSFPRPGTTLALDFPMRGTETLQLLACLNDIVAAAGGAVYPAKDACMGAAHFRGFFPGLEDFQPHIDPAFSSSFWRRVVSGEA